MAKSFDDLYKNKKLAFLDGFLTALVVAQIFHMFRKATV